MHASAVGPECVPDRSKVRIVALISPFSSSKSRNGRSASLKGNTADSPRRQSSTRVFHRPPPRPGHLPFAPMWSARALHIGANGRWPGRGGGLWKTLVEDCRRGLSAVFPFNDAERPFLDLLLENGEINATILTLDRSGTHSGPTALACKGAQRAEAQGIVLTLRLRVRRTNAAANRVLFAISVSYYHDNRHA